MSIIQTDKNTLFTIYLAGYTHGNNECSCIPETGTFEAFERLLKGEQIAKNLPSYDIKDKITEL